MGLQSLSQNRWVKAAKLLFVIVFLPFLVALAAAFIRETNSLSFLLFRTFYAGVAVYLLFHIFIYEPVKFYRRSQKLIEFVFSIFAPVFKVSYYIIPFWILVVLAAYFLLVVWLKIIFLLPFFFFLSGFVFTMHLVMVAKIMKTDKIGKVVDYLFLIFWVIAINLLFLSLNLQLYSEKFSFAVVVKTGIKEGASFFQHIFRQLFVPAVK